MDVAVCHNVHIFYVFQKNLYFCHTILNIKNKIMDTKQIKIEVADPTTLGLFGLAIVTLVASSQKLGITTGLSLMLPWALFIGGFAQVIAALFDFKHNNLFGATAFGAYGLFWIGMSMSWLIRLGCFGEALVASADIKQMGFAFVGYFFLTVVFTVSAIKMSKAMFFLLLLIAILFLGLALDAFGCGHIWHFVAAYSELTISLMAFYVLAAKYLNSFFGREVLCTGKPFCSK
jgi:succinate-acetate transporter protein